jgi:hypothetical protein
MSDDLDELARAARESPWVPIPPVPPIRRQRGLTTPVIVAIAVGGASVIAIGVFVLVSLFGRSEPRFSIVRETKGQSGILVDAVWEVENEGQSPLVISRVRLNDEFDCPLAEMAGGFVQGVNEKPMPVTLTIGESARFVEFFLTGLGPFGHRRVESNYQKSVIFVDIDTNRGSFRYRDGILTAH